MKLETKCLIVALSATILAWPASIYMQRAEHRQHLEQRRIEKLQIELDAKEKQIKQDELKRKELEAQLQAKLERDKFLATLHFSVGGAPAEKVRDALAFYLDKGLSKTATAYLVGNLIAESRLDHTNKTGDGGHAWGLAQWHPNRRYDMPATYEGQLAFVLTEMQRTTPSAYNIITNDPSPSSAAQAMKIFEGYSIEGARFSYAQQILGRI